MVRAVSLALALLMTVTWLRAASAAGCADEDCHRPCCDRDADNQTVLPVLPCCRTVTLDQASPSPAPTTVDSDQVPAATPIGAGEPLSAFAIEAPIARPSPAPLFAPPLYHRHCALLL